MGEPVEAPRRHGPRGADRWPTASLRLGWSLGVVLEVGADDASFALRDGVPGMLGWTRRHLALIPAAQLIHPDDRELIPTIASWARRDPTRFVPFDLRLLSRDSRYHRIRWSLCQRPDRAFVAVADCVLGPDSDTGPAVGVWEWNSGADTVAWSGELLDMFGFRDRPPAGYARALDVVLPEDRLGVASTVERALESGEPFVVTFRGAAPGRRDRWFQATGRRFEHDGGRRLGGIVKDLNPACTAGDDGRIIGCG